jgi:hypothetical protein
VGANVIRDSRSRDKYLDYAEDKIDRSIPCETPPHNGQYLGTVPVRTIPPGVMGGEKSDMGLTSEKALERQRQLNAERSATIAKSIRLNAARGRRQTTDKELRRAISRLTASHKPQKPKRDSEVMSPEIVDPEAS